MVPPLDKANADGMRSTESEGPATTPSDPPRRNRFRRGRPPERVEPLPSDALTPELWTAAPAQVEQLSRLYLHAQLTMWGEGLDYAKRLIVEALTAARGVLTNPPKEGNLRVVTGILDARTGQAADYIHRRAMENARRRYVCGLAVGFVASLALLAALMLIAKPFIMWFIGLRNSAPINDLPPDEFYALRDVLVCLGGGAAGAAVSVLLRLRREDLKYETVNNGAAVYRIMLGWFFAAAVLFLLKGGLVTIFNTPDEYSVSSWFYWGAVGFLAGFNERWATGLISRDPDQDSATRRRPPRPSQAPASGPVVDSRPGPDWTTTPHQVEPGDQLITQGGR